MVFCMEVSEATALTGARSMGAELADAVISLMDPIQRVSSVTASQVWDAKAAATMVIVTSVSPTPIIVFRDAVRLKPRRIR